MKETNDKENTGKIKLGINELQEILQDFICFDYMLKIQNSIKDKEVKSYISLFLKSIVPIIVYEFLKAIDGKNMYYPNMKEKVEKERMMSLKEKIGKSTKNKMTVQEMGIDFNNEVFDLVITISNGELISTNYDVFLWQLSENQEFWNNLFNTPSMIIKYILDALEEITNTKFKHIQDFKAFDVAVQDISSKIKIKRYSYSVKKMFSKEINLEEKDKIVILYYYRLIKSLLLIEDIIPTIKIENNNYVIVDFHNFIMKYKAIVIGLIYSDLKDMNTEYTKIILDEINTAVTDKCFYRLNRKLRNNIHYGEKEILSIEELNIIEHYQDIYFQIIIKNFDNAISINIDKKCMKMTEFSNYVSKSGISEKELKKYYYYYYLKFSIIRKLKK